MVSGAEERLRRAREALRAAELGTGLLRAADEELVPEGPARGVFHVPGGNGALIAALARALPPGGWGGVVGVPDLGWEAVGRAGIDLSRLLVVADPGSSAAQACALLLDGVDVVCIEGGLIETRARGRLAGIARLRRRALLTTSPWAGVSRPWSGAEGGRAVS